MSFTPYNPFLTQISTFKMEKTIIIDQISKILNKTLQELEDLKQEVEQEQSEQDLLLEKINKIEDDCSEIRKGVIG